MDGHPGCRKHGSAEDHTGDSGKTALTENQEMTVPLWASSVFLRAALRFFLKDSGRLSLVLVFTIC
jgi:hypothetical protein